MGSKGIDETHIGMILRAIAGQVCPDAMPLSDYVCELGPFIQPVKAIQPLAASVLVSITSGRIAGVETARMLDFHSPGRIMKKLQQPPGALS